MPIATVIDLLTNSLLGIRVHRMGASAPPEMVAHALDMLNLMLETWTVDKRQVFRVQEVIATLTSAQTYTIGTGGAINTTRPSAIRPGFTRVGGTDYPYEVISAAEYASIGTKTQASTAPNAIYYEIAVPLGVLHCWPVSGGELHLMVDQALEGLAIGDSLSFPEGYQEAIMLALGKRLAPVYGQTLSPEYLDNLQQAETALRRRNHRAPMATVFMPGRGRVRDNSYIFTGGQ
jgi:hypothetical protein